MKTLLTMIAVALAAVGMVDAKPVEHCVMHPIAYPTNPELEKHHFKCKKHHKHHARPYRHGKRHHRCHYKFGRKPMNAPIVRPVRKRCK